MAYGSINVFELNSSLMQSPGEITCVGKILFPLLQIFPQTSILNIFANKVIEEEKTNI